MKTIHRSMCGGIIVIHNVIGPPGAGKTTYIRRHFGFSPPVKTIDDEVFDKFVKNKVFEHTGLNPGINRYLAASNEPVSTIWFQTSIPVCIFRIVSDFLKGKTSLKQTNSRIKILCYYHRNAQDIYTGKDKENNDLVVIRKANPVTAFIRKKMNKW
ncbi:MAG: hypothetical protein ACQEQN_06155 [Thermodesulfobacteriota bacterium]